MDEDFLDVTNSSKKTGLILFFVILIIALLGYFFVFRNFHFSARNIDVELGSTLSTDINDYLSKKVTNKSAYTLDLRGVNPNEVGDYKYTITYNRRVKTGKIKVEDTTAPEFTLQELVIEEGSEYFLGDLLTTCEDLSKPCLVTLKNTKDDAKLAQKGEYNIPIVVQDVYGNKKLGNASIKVVGKGEYTDPRTQDLEYASSSKEVKDIESHIYHKLEKAIDSSSEEARDMAGIVGTVDLENYVKVNFEGYRLVDSELIELYNKSKFVIGYAIEIKITNGTERTVYVEKDKIPTETQTQPEQ